MKIPGRCAACGTRPAWNFLLTCKLVCVGAQHSSAKVFAPPVRHIHAVATNLAPLIGADDTTIKKALEVHGRALSDSFDWKDVEATIDEVKAFMQ